MIAVVGAGSWGTALANILACKGLPVVLWGRNTSFIEQLRNTSINEKYLPNIELSKKIKFTSNLMDIKSAKVIIIATPSAFMRAIAKELYEIKISDTILVSCAKGLEEGSFYRMSEILEQELPNNSYAVLSGPNHAESVSNGDPTATVLASKDIKVLSYLQELLATDSFRPYTSVDILGVELAGAFKNIIALANGVLVGIGYGDNTSAALMTRGIVEIARLGSAMGAKDETFSGLAGIGDLIVTCISKHSRNRRAGELLGKGCSLEDVLHGTDMVIEGIKATKIAYLLAKKYNVEMPITEKLYQILYENKPVNVAIKELMLRDYKEDNI